MYLGLVLGRVPGTNGLQMTKVGIYCSDQHGEVMAYREFSSTSLALDGFVIKLLLIE